MTRESAVLPRRGPSVGYNEFRSDKIVPRGVGLDPKRKGARHQGTETRDGHHEDGDWVGGTDSHILNPVMLSVSTSHIIACDIYSCWTQKLSG
ncbi:hypothetical protein CFRS1_v009016 [Colletotrichum fructicola]|nr:hypothetical protein CFRS1_v009016 [Colletotrichum fructicola]